MDRNALRDFYISQLQDNFLPYWLPFYDEEDGGILNCISNYGDKKLSDNKFTWSQGRYLWVLGRLYGLCQRGVLTKPDMDVLLHQMEGTYRFLADFSMDEKGVCCYLLDKKGNKLVDARTGRYDASIFADCFALIGMAQYTKVTLRRQNLPTVKKLYDSIVGRVESGDYLTEPYPLPEGYRTHSIPMIMVNSVYEYVKMRESFGLDCREEIAYGLSKAHFILTQLCRNGYIREYASTDENYETRMMDRHVTPGHTLEDVWFMCEYLADYGDLPKWLEQLAGLARNAMDIGWDETYGGLLHYVDREGGMPKGTATGDPFEENLLGTWNMKLWWPHSEMLYTMLYLYERTGDEDFMRRYQKAQTYVFATFPNKELGEWVQIRRRDNTPEDKVVALPVKDPFHIMRNFLKIVELYSK